MRDLKYTVDKKIEKILILLGVLLVLVPISPINMRSIYRDSGVFLYTGSRILLGELPYLHVWDHKPPVIFYLNALGLFLGDGSRWGVWLLELLALLLAAFIGFKLLKKAFGVLPAILSLYLWLFSLFFLLNGGNMTTEYTLPLQFACLYLAYDAEKHGFFTWRGFLIGMLCSVAFLTKQNTIGIGIAIVAYLVVSRSVSRQFKKLSSELLSIFLGAVSFLLLTIIYFGTQGIILNFWDSAFIYNFIYSASNQESRFLAVLSGLKLLSSTYLAQLAFIGWIAGLLLIFFGRSFNRELRSLIIIALIDLPVELFLVSLTGRSYKHYFMALLPIFSFFSGLAFWLLITVMPQEHRTKKFKLYLTMGLLAIFSLFNANRYLQLVVGYRQPSSSLISYIEQSTADDDTVLLWGAETAANFLSGRRSPSRFVYQYPLYMTGYASEQIIVEFLLDTIQKKPRLIIDTKNPNTPFMEFNIDSDQIEAHLKYLRSHYMQVEKLGSWIIYEYVDTP